MGNAGVQKTDFRIFREGKLNIVRLHSINLKTGKMTPKKDGDLYSFKFPGPLPPAFVMELQSFMNYLPFDKESDKYADCFKAQITYFKDMSRAAVKFYTEIENILKKPGHGM